MKKTLTIFFLLSLIIGSLAAQMGGQGNPPPTPEVEMERFDKELGLNSSQEKTFLKILTDFSEEMEEIMESGTRPDRNTMETLMEERDNSLKECLSDKQIELFDSMSQDMMPPRP